MESPKTNHTAVEAEQLLQLELFGLGRLMACIAQLQPTSKRKLFRGLLLAAVNRPSEVAVIEPSGEIMMSASVPDVAGYAGCSERSIQRYSKSLSEVVTKEETVNTPAEWWFNLRDVLPAESIPWFVSIVETGDPDCICHPDSGVTEKAVTPTESFCRGDSHPDSRGDSSDLANENTGSKMSYDLRYDLCDVGHNINHKKTALSKADFDLLTSRHAAAKASGTKTVGSVVTMAQAELNVDLGLRCFAAIDFADVQRIAGFEIDGVRWGMVKRREIVSAYFADAVKARTADLSELGVFTATMFMAARRKPQPPVQGEDERAGYLRKCWDNRAWREISTSKEDEQNASKLLGESEMQA